jgi:hypothetical protein
MMVDLERVRKTLTAQLFDLRQEMGPREELLSSTQERLREVEREYEHTLHAMNDKDSQLAREKATALMLQGQNRELRMGTAKKDQILRRAAAQLVEFRLSYQHAVVNAVKRPAVLTIEKPLPGYKTNRLEEHLVVSEDMCMSLERLHEILSPFSTSEIDNEQQLEDQIERDVVTNERERHMQLLSRNVVALKESMEIKERVVSKHTQGHISDNMGLLTEVNSLRKEVLPIYMTVLWYRVNHDDYIIL